MTSRSIVYNQIAVISTETLYLILLKIVGGLALFSDETVRKLPSLIPSKEGLPPNMRLV